MKGSLSKGAFGFRPKKSLGQHFLQNQQIIHNIISKARFQGSDMVLEIGPGKGALTLPLARNVSQVIAVEKDAQLVGQLERKLMQEGIRNVTLVHEDILKYDFQKMALSPSAKVQVIGNLPYNISTPVLERLIDNRGRLSKAVLMFQLEIAERLTASPGNKTYGAMTVLVQYHARALRLFGVSKNAFFPKPKVDSMVVELDFERPHPNPAKDEMGFKKLVRGAFAHRRKTLLNSLKHHCPFLDSDVLIQGIKKCGIDPRTRAESLDIDDFVRLASGIDIDKKSDIMIKFKD